MASILPKCPHCGTHHVYQTYIDTDSKERRYRCLNPMCRRYFTIPFTSAVYTAPTGKPADNGKPELCNERTELHNFWDALDLYCEPDFDNDDEYNSWVADEMRRDAWDAIYGGNG